jgi:hypothetical protein
MILPPPWSPGSFYALGTDLDAATYEVWRTEDFGETWFTCGDSLPEYPGTSLPFANLYLGCHPTEAVLYAALEGSGVWRWDVSASAVHDAEGAATSQVRLFLYPNPSTGRFQYGVHLPRSEHVVLRLYDVHGRLLRTLKDGFVPAGTHLFDWCKADDGDFAVGSGLFYLRLDTEGCHTVRKITLIR